MNTGAIVVFSGGQDSTTCLYWAKRERYDIKLALTIDYNQRHHRELEAAVVIAHAANIPHEVLTVGPILQGTSPLVSDSKLEQYENFNSLPGGLEKTFVPMRNQLFLTLAANRAAVLGASVIITGVCEEDYGGYPDCRRVFIDQLELAMNFSLGISDQENQNHVRIETPLMKLTKKQTVELALELPGCYQALAYSHTAYDGKFPPVGQDHATLLRAKGFYEADVPDPLVLRAWSLGLMDLPAAGNYRDVLVQPYLDKLSLKPRPRIL